MASSSSIELKFKSESIPVETGSTVGEASETVMANDHNLLIYRGLKKAKKERGVTAKERISKMPPCVAGKRSSIYRGVTRHRWTGRYEAHLWDKSTWNQNQNKKGKQVLLGAYDEEEAAARAYDLAALKYWGPGTLINFPVSDYSRDLEEMQNISREDYLASLRRKSSGFSRGISKHRGLSRPPQNSRWETSLGQMSMPEYLSSIRYGEGASIENEYPGGFCFERKIDLTGYFKWWATNKPRRIEKSSDESKFGGQEDFASELKALERGLKQTEPYKMPRLGLKHQGSALSALSVLSRSAAYQNLKENVSKEKNENNYNDENKNSEEMEYCKSIQKPSDYGGGSVTLGMNWLPFQRASCPLTPFISAPILTHYNTIDPGSDPVHWTSLVSVPPHGLPFPTEVTKTETSSTYTCFHHEEQ
ncbi:hypothetical protein ACHQM5_018930 [Ranunculus cassubicifolius]